MGLTASVIDLWIHTTDMLRSISNKVVIKTNDYLYYVIYATDRKHTRIGSVNKSYASENSHVKCITVQLRYNSFYMQVRANESEIQILNKLSKISERILKENMLIQIESM